MKTTQPERPEPPVSITVSGANAAAILQQLVDRHGLSFGDCVAACHDPELEPFVTAAQNHRLLSEGTLEVDAKSVVSQSDDGSYVMAWLWIDNATAGVEEPDGHAAGAV